MAKKRIKKSTEYNSWKGMIERCSNPNHIGYKYYGARGITVCERWRTSFAAFAEDMGPKPTPRHTLDRENTDGNYEPGNCRWATYAEQRANQRPYDETWRVSRSWQTGKRSRVSKQRIDMTGQRYGKLVVLSYADTFDKKARWLCRCDCGVEKVIAGIRLRIGTVSCGCVQRKAASERLLARSKEHNRQSAIKGWQTRKAQKASQ